MEVLETPRDDSECRNDGNAESKDVNNNQVPGDAASGSHGPRGHKGDS